MSSPQAISSVPLKKREPSLRKKKVSSQTGKEKILQELEKIYKAALISKKFTVALRALEMRGKEIGLFNEKNKPSLRTLSEMSDEELHAFLKEE